MLLTSQRWSIASRGKSRFQSLTSRTALRALSSCHGCSLIRFGVNEREHNVMGAAGAGAIATLFHDSIMTPMDVIKQRLQLGYYKGMMHCISSILQTEGPRA